VKEGPKPETQRAPRWDSFLLGYVAPRWDAGVRYWPGAVILGSSLPLFVGLTIAFGFTNGPLLTAAVVASYPILLVLAPVRKRLVPREIGSAASAAPMRIWVTGFFLFAAMTASYSLFVRVVIDAGRPANPIAFFGLYGLEYGLLMGSVWCVRKAPAWEQWRHRPRKKAGKAPQDGHGAPTGAATLGQPH